MAGKIQISKHALNSRVRQLTGVALGVAFAGTVAGVGGPYLPGLGPIPLRFATKPPPATEAVAATQSANDSGLARAANQDSPPLSSTNSNILAATDAAASAVADNSSNDSVTDSATVAPAPPTFIPAESLAAMTPQVLAEYFHPVAGRTNSVGAVLVLPVDASFTPPVPKSGVASQATYRVQ